jgi:hypothetical protein
MLSLLEDIISKKEIDLLKEGNHFPSTKNFSMAIASIVLILFTKL